MKYTLKAVRKLPEKTEAKMKVGECRCTTKGMQYCKTDEGFVRFTGKCPPPSPAKESEE